MHSYRQGIPNREPIRRSPIRVLFACSGWPSGLWDVASWARRRGGAEPLLVPCEPGRPFRSPLPRWLAESLKCLDPRQVDAAREALGGPLIQKLLDFDPHVVGFRVEGGDCETVKARVSAARLFSRAEIVLGGPTATSHPRDVLVDSGADYVFAGEAEASFCRFLNKARLPNSADHKTDISGLAYRHGGRVYHNTLPADGYERTILDDPSPLPTHQRRRLAHRRRPAPSGHLIEANRLDWSMWECFEQPFDSLYFTAGRGCPGSCSFCARLHGQNVRFKSAPQLLEEIEGADAKLAQGVFHVTRWNLFQYCADPAFRAKKAAWAAVYDEDFFLHRRRAIDFFKLWAASPLRRRYRLGFQTNPCSLIDGRGRFDAELFTWIDRLKPLIQLGAESFHPDMLARWQKRHRVDQLRTVLDALDGTRQDYGIFILLTDFDSTPEELIESLRLLVLEGLCRRRMRIASSPFTIPLFDAEVRRRLEFSRRLPETAIQHFTDYERPRPEWLDPLVAELADLADAELRFALELENREAALVRAFEVVVERLAAEPPSFRIHQLRLQADRAMGQIRDARFQAVWP